MCENELFFSRVACVYDIELNGRAVSFVCYVFFASNYLLCALAIVKIKMNNSSSFTLRSRTSSRRLRPRLRLRRSQAALHIAYTSITRKKNLINRVRTLTLKLPPKIFI